MFAAYPNSMGRSENYHHRLEFGVGAREFKGKFVPANDLSRIEAIEASIKQAVTEEWEAGKRRQQKV